MEYIGAADFYFWEGVKAAQNDKEQHPDLTLQFNNQVVKEAIDAYNWGFCLGLVLTSQEYIDLTTSPKDDTIDFIKETKKQIDEMVKNMTKTLNDSLDNHDSDASTKLVGNC